jgi:hypothetical protein
MKVIKYDPSKTYMFPNGELATPEKVQEQFPAMAHFTHIIETDGEVLFAVQNLSAMRNFHGIDPALTEAEAITAIEVIVNTPVPEPEPSAEERIAAAMEFQNLMMI